MSKIKEAFAVHTGDIYATTFDCGCVWRWYIGKPSPLNHKWEKRCDDHAAQVVPQDCTCLNVGHEDGATTCWQHHDCSDGSCTHGE